MSDLIAPGIGITQGSGVTSGVGIAPLLGAQGFDLKALFASGEQGAILDPSQISTLFQDISGTTPVATDGDPVGLVLDVSRDLQTGPNVWNDENMQTTSASMVPVGLPGDSLRLTAPLDDLVQAAHDAFRRQ